MKNKDCLTVGDLRDFLRMIPADTEIFTNSPNRNKFIGAYFVSLDDIEKVILSFSVDTQKEQFDYLSRDNSKYKPIKRLSLLNNGIL